MESTQNLKKRLKSVANIGKITKAMELVAATKMRRSQEIALASRPYAFVALDLLANISTLEKKAFPALLKPRKISKTLFVLVASDKGLAGSFNSSLFKKFEKFISQEKIHGDFVAVGEKTAAYLQKRGMHVVQKFTNVGDYTTQEQVQPLADFLIKGYLAKKWDRVLVFSTHFTSALKQDPLAREILPIHVDSIKETLREITPKTGKFAELLKEHELEFSGELSKGYLIEPSAKVVLEDLIEHLFFMQVYHLILEANASEHSARRMAMKTASDNASDLSETLNLEYNKVRQAGITTQIIEIVAGSESLS